MTLPRALLATLLIAGLGLLSPPAAATDSTSVGPNQQFLGEVNGNHSGAVVYLVCPGPGIPGGTGHPAGNQSLAVIRVNSGPGHTGASAKRIVVRFRDDPSGPVTLRTYGLTKTIPTSLELPCTGSGKIRFVPKPRGDGTIADIVPVTYENIAA